ncbi:Rv1355c family protein [Brevibacillus sp. MCWH]|jgi:molybdopterin/thiamine biosynthesis adenylyltransferase|uniref:Rv1355c family protein n=1 Tax=Brevibacillus sp. MCWH TaxID=2508871 RepID=UPI0014909205|nr:Rv1355c family protein [Brevibacillus sp. MCWH]NNV03791.1 Rv1355c family protein [Brevibacillus sp. MCWH]
MTDLRSLLAAHTETRREEWLYTPLFFRLRQEDDRRRLQDLCRCQNDLVMLNPFRGQVEELIETRHPDRQFSREELQAAVDEYLGDAPEEKGVWVYYPWRKTLVHLLDEEEFVFVRTNRNRNKITQQEQEVLARKAIGVIGLSVGQSLALTLAMERVCGEIRLADFDTLELSNLNRIRAGVHHLGMPKVIVTAREIAEIDPFLKVVCFADGVNEENLDRFLVEGGRLDILVDECDSLNMKILCRLKARELGIPVVMDTSDRGLLDVERFDLEPDRPILHGLVDGLDYDTLKGLSNQEKIPYVLRIVGGDAISARLRMSLLEVGKTVCTWPQLASSVTLGAAVGTDVCRRIALGQFRASGRFYVDLEQLIADGNCLVV